MRGELVDDVRNYYSREDKEKQILKYLLLIDKNKYQSINFVTG